MAAAGEHLLSRRRRAHRDARASRLRTRASSAGKSPASGCRRAASPSTRVRCGSISSCGDRRGATLRLRSGPVCLETRTVPIFLDRLRLTGESPARGALWGLAGQEAVGTLLATPATRDAGRVGSRAGRRRNVCGRLAGRRRAGAARARAAGRSGAQTLHRRLAAAASAPSSAVRRCCRASGTDEA